ncbi:MAG TPA: SusC/RagA family TonB-linked outer membrane protein [Gemmatimonadaceae bacterium]|nr:SusC/RagA family TonB-linked outer membrane protein [Gemmatimonadaceae bacterium]
MHVLRPWGGRWRLPLAALLAVAIPAMAQAQKATITGHVTTVGTGAPVAFGQVMVVGTTLGTTTGSDGAYTIRNVPAGTLEVRVLRVGFQGAKKAITVTAGQQATLDFALSAVAVQLQGVVTTYTGSQRVAEMGNSVATLGNIGKEVETKPVTDLTDLMVAKAPGVTVLPGNMTGSAPTIRIRGLNSISLDNAPLYVIDGVRMNSDAIGLGIGGTQASYLNTLDPEQIASIEILKGPSAATLYGTSGANGVVVITTKRGQVGSTRWNFHAQDGMVQDRNNYMTQYAIWGHDPKDPSSLQRCVLVHIADGSCVADSTTSLNIFNSPDLTPLATGNHQDYGVEVSGGTPAIRYFVSGDLTSETGPVRMPDFGVQYFDSVGTPVRDEWKNPEHFRRNSFRANLNMSLSPTFDLALSSSFGQVNERLPNVDNNLFSYLYNAFQNPGFRGPGLGYSDIGGLGEDLHSYAFFTPAQIFQQTTEDGINRYIGSLTGDWRPFSWMENGVTVGIDYDNENYLSINRFGEGVAFSDNRQGSIFSSRTDTRDLTAKAHSTVSWQATRAINLKTTVGLGYENTGNSFTTGSGSHLPPGGQQAGQAAILSGDSQLLAADKTLGIFAEEAIAFNDRLYINGGVRTDQNSAFGTDFQRVYYPHFQVSWIISDESFFPHFSWLNRLRLRSAYGASGVQPRSTDALRTFSANAVNIANIPGSGNSKDTPGLLADRLGNQNLKPETSSEIEGGFESQIFHNRVSLDFTYFHKKTTNALIDEQIAASSGASRLTLLENLGSTENKGIEASVNATILDMPDLEWDITVGGSHVTNKVLSLGLDPTGKPNPTIGQGSERRDTVGLPINSYFARPFTYADANGDGIIGEDEVTVSPDFQYLGYSFAPNLATISSGVGLLHNKLRLTALLDYKGGFKLFNNDGDFFCLQSNQCYDETHKNASLFAQARLVADRYGSDGLKTDYGYYEDGSFWRLREVAATFTLPERWARVIHASDASLNFSARNLHVWTNFTGTDPESNYGDDDVQTNFATTAPPSYFLFRLNLHY